MAHASELTPADRQAKERERNRRKQQAYRDRQKQLRRQARQQGDDNQPGTVQDTETSSSSVQVIKRQRTTVPLPAKHTLPQPSSTDRMVAKLISLGVDQDEIDRLVSGASSDVDGGHEAVDKVREPLDELTTRPHQPVVVRRRVSVPETAYHSPAGPSTFEHSPTTLFAGLLNDAIPAPRLETFLPPTPESIGSPPMVDLLRHALGLSLEPQMPRQLASYTYNSPVSFEADGRPLDWKVSLFALHHECHVQRHHPTKGYLHNEAVRKMVDMAQFAILQLRGPHVRAPAGHPAWPEWISPEDEALLESITDPRLTQCQHRRHKVLVYKAIKANELDVTEFLGHCIETARFHSDPWDLAPASFPASFLATLPASLTHMVVAATPAAKTVPQTKGASLREILLGLDAPGWRERIVDRDMDADRHFHLHEYRAAPSTGTDVGEHVW